MKKSFKTLFAFLFFLAFLSPVFSDDFDSSDTSLGASIGSLTGHRFIEVKGAIPFYPVLTSHGFSQSFVAGFSNFAEALFSGGKDYDGMTPQLATDINCIFYTPFTGYRLAFMAGLAIDTWESGYKENGIKKYDDIFMNFYYAGLHVDYGHWVFSGIGTSLSIYGEFVMGTLGHTGGGNSQYIFSFDFCPFGIQFCPEKHIGIYFEMPHLGSRPFFQTGVSIGL
ncbi:MAG: hypothetical protein K5873_01415 [Treponema sp.]|nr:hypothetical protein [Treponema sp.]